MGIETVSIDEREQRIVVAERMIGQLRARQIADLAELDVAQVALADGSRSLSEWAAARLDVAPDTARELVRTMRRLQDRPDLEKRLGDGETTFDRVSAVSRISGDVGLMEHADVAGVRREAAKRIRVTAETESRNASDRFLVSQPNLDESWWKLWGGLDGASGALFDKVLSEAADALPGLPDGTRGSQSWRRATALIECVTSGEAPPAHVTVIVDAKEAAETSGEAGVVLEAGIGVGREALERILCDAVTEVTARTEDGRFMDYGRKQRTAPPALKRALLAQTNHQCSADGCNSSDRLQIHHLVPWAKGGETNQADLVVLCWFHHQVVVHERGFEIYLHRPGRIRFQKPKHDPYERPPSPQG